MKRAWCIELFCCADPSQYIYIYIHKGIISTSCSRCKQDNYSLFDKNIYYYELLTKQTMYDFWQIFHRTI